MKENISELFKKFIEDCRYIKRLRPETIRTYSEAFKTFIKVMPEVVNVKLLTREMLTLYFKRLETRGRKVGKDTIKIGVKDSTIKTYQNRLNVFFTWLVNMQHIETNPFIGMKFPNPVYEDSRALEQDSIDKIFAAVALHSINSLIHKRDIAILSLLMFCGLRRNELISLQVNDVDFENSMLVIKGETSKSKKTHSVPLHPTLGMHLKDYLKERCKKEYKTQYLIISTNRDRGLSSDGLKHWVKRLVKLSGVKFHLHKFRHTFACNLAKNNVSVFNIQTLMGHKDYKMTLSYLRSVKTKDLRDEINRLYSNVDNFH
ncbi:MAG: site-specific integrase [Patescibacteria group bacterium]